MDMGPENGEPVEEVQEEIEKKSITYTTKTDSNIVVIPYLVYILIKLEPDYKDKYSIEMVVGINKDRLTSKKFMSEFSWYSNFNQSNGWLYNTMKMEQNGFKIDDNMLVINDTNSQNNLIKLYSESLNSNEAIGYSSSNTQVAWGDDLMGGIVYSDKDPSKGYISIEFYNNSGNMVMNGYGSKKPPSLGVHEDFSFNSYSSSPDKAPDIIKLKMSEFGGTIQVDLGNGYKDSVMNEIYSVIWKQSSDWSVGDVVYESTGWDLSGNDWITEYEPFNTIPTGTKYFGNEYYFENQWPLNFISPENTNYKINHNDNGTTEPYDDTWWIDQDGDNTYDQKWQGSGDINETSFYVTESDSYIHDPSNQDADDYGWVRQPYQVVSGSAIPTGLVFDSGAKKIKDDVEVEIDKVYQEYKDTDFTKGQELFSKLEDTSKFPNLE
jgi:hypothetical protein